RGARARHRRAGHPLRRQGRRLRLRLRVLLFVWHAAEADREIGGGGGGALGGMTTSGEALEQALGLLRAPALRGSLRARPLPAGMEEVLAIASGSQERARAAADRTGYDAAELGEAARFYVQQVLLA